MIAITAFAVQEFVSKAGVIDETPQEVRTCFATHAVGFQYIGEGNVGVREEGVAIDEENPIWGVCARQSLMHHTHLAIVGFAVRQRDLSVKDIVVAMKFCVSAMIWDRQARKRTIWPSVRSGVGLICANAMDLDSRPE